MWRLCSFLWGNDFEHYDMPSQSMKYLNKNFLANISFLAVESVLLSLGTAILQLNQNKFTAECFEKQPKTIENCTNSASKSTRNRKAIEECIPWTQHVN